MDVDGGDGGGLLAGRYRLTDEVGSGDTGVVWRAVDERMGREVAVKEVQAPKRRAETGERRIELLKQQGQVAARVRHPHVVTVHGVIEQNGRPWIVMELVRGRSLDEILDQVGRVRPQEAARIGAMVLRGLRSAHAAGVLHRGVKPSNILVAADGGRVVLTDLGMTVIQWGDPLTEETIGTYEWLAPECVGGGAPEPPSDLWSLGATLYAAVEGVSPFRRDTVESTLRAVLYEALPAPRCAGPLTPVIEGLLRRDPRARMAAEEAQQLLDGIAMVDAAPVPDGGRSTRDRSALWIAVDDIGRRRVALFIGVLLALLLAVGGVAVWAVSGVSPDPGRTPLPTVPVPTDSPPPPEERPPPPAPPPEDPGSDCSGGWVDC